MKSLIRLGLTCAVAALWTGLGPDASGATFTATNEAELAQAIADANVNAGDDVIEIDTPDGVNTVITLTAPLPEIAGNLLIVGEGQDAVRISGGGVFRVFFVQSGDVTFRNMTIGDGLALGFNGGDSLSGGGGGSPGVGGGIYVRSGRTFLESVTIDNCHAIGGTGGSVAGGGNGGGGGAGFEGDGEASLGNVGGDGGVSGVFNGDPGTGGLEADGTFNPNGTNGGTGAGGGGGGGAIDPNAGGRGGAGGFLGGGGGGGAGSTSGRSGNGGNGGFGAGGGAAGLDTGGGSGTAGAGGRHGGAGGRSETAGIGNGGGGGAGLGGGLFVDTNATAVASDVTFSNNSATGALGGFGGNGGETDDDGANGLGKGGAIYVIGGSLVAFEDRIVFENNVASDAGTGGQDNDDVFGRLVPLEDDNGGGSGGCFIATAAYGTPAARDLEVLRAFRDEFMLDNPVGLFMADAYYRMSPPIADAIAQRPLLAALVRLALAPVVVAAGLLLSPAGPGLLLAAGLLAAGIRRCGALRGSSSCS